MQELDLHERPGHVRCPICLDGIEEGQEALACPACGTSHHAACLREIDGTCATQGCGRVLLPLTDLVRLVGPARPLPRRRDLGPRIGTLRPCDRCGQEFEIEVATRYSPVCPACRASVRRRNVALAVALVVISLAIWAAMFFIYP